MSRVLIVDDDRSVLHVLTRLIALDKHEVVGVSDSVAAAAAVREGHFDVALVDYSLGAVDGLSVLHTIRQADPSCARILMSGNLQVPVIVNALNNHTIHQVLAKPLSRSTLRSALANCQHIPSRLKEDLDHFQESARSKQRRQLQRLLDGGHLQVALQPILTARAGQIFAHEALLRSSMPELPGPLEVISAAGRCGMLHDITAGVVQRVAEWMPRLPEGSLLFMNLHPDELDDVQSLTDSLAPLRRWSRSIVLEVTEHSQVRQQWTDAVRRLREQGFSIAVDDLGSGYNSLTSLAVLQPAYIKVDMSITRDIDTDSYKHRLMALLVQLAESTGSTLIAEGVETDSEAATLKKLGVHLVQGYLFARPSLSPDFSLPARLSA